MDLDGIVSRIAIRCMSIFSGNKETRWSAYTVGIETSAQYT